MKRLARLAERTGTFRMKRFELFSRQFKPQSGDILLDAGAGSGTFLETFAGREADIVALDISGRRLASLRERHPQVLLVRGDATQLPFKSGSVSIAVSNSVIEHVGDLEAMGRMASEIERVGKRHFVQTPNRYFPIEPHYMLPFFQFFPYGIKRWLSRHFRLGFYNPGDIEVDNPKLLSAKQFRKMFPGSKIVRERFLFLTKSLIAIR